jgi:hypothetical protein
MDDILPEFCAALPRDISLAEKKTSITITCEALKHKHKSGKTYFRKPFSG